jgi:hypothetical protein
MKAITTTLVNGETVAVSSADVEQMADVCASLMDSEWGAAGVYDEVFNNLVVAKGEDYAYAVVNAAQDTLLEEFGRFAELFR